VSDINVTVVSAEQSAERTVTTGTKAWELFADDSAVIAARIDGELRDLAHVLEAGAKVEPVAIDSADGHDILRHSTAHVMAQAVQELFPDAKLGIGPPITDGFYYDFDVEVPFHPDVRVIARRTGPSVSGGTCREGQQAGSTRRSSASSFLRVRRDTVPQESQRVLRSSASGSLTDPIVRVSPLLIISRAALTRRMRSPSGPTTRIWVTWSVFAPLVQDSRVAQVTW